MGTLPKPKEKKQEKRIEKRIEKRNRTMSKAEKFIQDYTKKCSNELCAVEDRFGKKVISYYDWLTPDEARKAVEIAREEIYEWLKENADIYTWYNEFIGESGMTNDFIDDLKKAMEDE